MNPRCQVGVLAMGLWLSAGPAVYAQQAVGATFGDVIQLQGGTPSDIVLDELRHQLYLVSNTTSQVLVLDYTTNQVVARIATGRTPLAGAMSMDGNFLYVTASGPPSALYAIDLTSNRLAYTQTLPSTPQGVETGIDGRVLVAMTGTGVTAGVPQKTLQVFDPTTRTLLDVSVPALTTTLAPLPAQPTGRPTTTFPGKLLRTPDGNFIVGVITPTNASTYIFVYEVASGVILRNRITAGQSTVISMAPDGSRFMAGFTMYDTATLAVIAQQNNANAPFTFSSAINTTQNVGGSIFSPDGNTLYSAFNTAATTNPPSPSASSTLLVNDPSNLGIRLGIKLPESIVAKIAMTSDGADAWGLSDSGLVHMPLGKLYEYPILVPETSQVFLAMDDCNRGVASGTLKINNLGKGRLTYTVAASPSAALVYKQSSGLAPSTITFTMEPGRSGVVRQPGTNIWTGAGTQQGTPINLTLSSPDAINIPNTIRIFMNYRQSDQRGVIYPVPTTQNNNPSGTAGNTSGNEGLQDILLDEARGLVYITNSGFNRIEVFDTQKQHFVNPIPAGQMPHQMAMGGDGKTLYVGNTGGESISIIDLDLQRIVDSVVFPPVQRNSTAAPIYPRSLAMGYFGLQFLMSNGTLWKVVGNQALPRPADPNGLVPVTLTGCPNCGMISTPANDFILTFSGNGTAYVYDSTADAYVATRLLIPAPITGYYGLLGAGPGGAYYLVNGLIVNPSLTTIGGSASPGATYARRRRIPRTAAGGFHRQHGQSQRGGADATGRQAPAAADDPRAAEYHHGDARRCAHDAGSGQPADWRRHAGRRGAGESGGERFRHNTVQHESPYDGGERGGDHGVHDHALRTERGFVDADRNRYAAGDRHARHRECGRRHRELQAGLVHRDQRPESGGRSDGGHYPAADGAGRLLCDVRRHCGSAAGLLQGPDTGTGSRHAAGGHARGGSALARYRAGVGPGGGHRAAVQLAFWLTIY